jgi:hypothetical protein
MSDTFSKVEVITGIARRRRFAGGESRPPFRFDLARRSEMIPPSRVILRGALALGHALLQARIAGGTANHGGGVVTR